MVTLSTSKLEAALRLSKELDQIKAKLENALNGIFDNDTRSQPTVTRRAKRGSLSSAVVSVLRSAKKPLHVAEIVAELDKRRVRFTKSKNPKKMLGIRIYQLAGVKKVGEGLFAPA